jgi:hypothetical protein
MYGSSPGSSTKSFPYCSFLSTSHHYFHHIKDSSSSDNNEEELTLTTLRVAHAQHEDMNIARWGGPVPQA